MGKIFCIVGKSSSGKDTIYKRLLKINSLKIKKIIPYTTRPIRQGEKEGVEYHFVDINRLEQLKKEDKIVECREYDTVYGKWYYFTAKDDQIELEQNDYLIIGTLESYMKTREYFGKDKVIPIFVDIDDGERLSRALRREMRQKEPKYDEMCRRYLADSMDFSEENLKNAGITRTFINDNVKLCTKAISNYIKIQMKNG
ncbi:MAG: guanylate kinase [Lachnospiraceae bacterium]|nr:guanylate kinase [Lachnospiraceae bacterium]MBQ2406489.1 guanylate kinase [Lachnospiraceae bacterium]MEE0919634.1 guanylate kinase [Lachnospiraceae bacterium]